MTRTRLHRYTRLSFPHLISFSSMRFASCSTDWCVGAAAVTHHWLPAPGSSWRLCSSDEEEEVHDKDVKSLVGGKRWVAEDTLEFQRLPANSQVLLTCCSHVTIMGWIQTRRSSCINLPSQKKKKDKRPPPWPRTVRRLWRCVLRRAEIIQGGGKKKTKKKTLLAEVINRKWSIHIHKAPTNLREWHQFLKGHPPPPSIYY